MKEKLSIILLIVVLISSCSSHEKDKVNEDANINPKFVTTLKRYFDNDGYVATASEDGIYMIDKGVLKYVDLESKKEISLTTLNIADDKEISEKCSGNYKRYCATALDGFLQYYDNHIFYITEEFTVEGANVITLYRMIPDGSKRETLLTIDKRGYNYLITKGHLIYIETNSERVISVNLNTHETQQIEIPNGHRFSKYLYSDEYFYIETYSKEESEYYIYSYDFKARELSYLFSGVVQTFSGINDKLIVYDIKSWEPLISDRKIVDQEMNLITLIDNDTRMLNYLDDNYIYTSSTESPQHYIIYNYEGDVVYDIEVPSSFKAEYQYIYGLGFKPIEASEIQGVVGDYLFVVGGAEDRIRYYLINFKTDEWYEIFESVVEVFSY